MSDFPPEQKKDIWGTAPLCDVIMGSEKTGALKPSIYTFGSLIDEFGLPAENILYVGNSIRSDVKGAKAAGMQTAYIAPRWRLLLKILPREADFSFINYRKLQKYVLKQNTKKIVTFFGWKNVRNNFKSITVNRFYYSYSRFSIFR